MAKVTFDVERCKGCGLCETVCPKQIIALSKEKINAKGMLKQLIIGIVIMFVLAAGTPLLINGLSHWVTW